MLRRGPERPPEPEPGQQLQERALAAAARLVALAAAGDPVVACSQGKVIPPALARLTGGTDDFATDKGGGWLLAFTSDGLLPPDRL